MKKVWLTLGLIFILTAGSGTGFQGFGNSSALAQPPPPPPYYNQYNYPPPYNYYNYYSAPYTDPLSQFLYYVSPQIAGNEERQEWENQEREYYQHGWHRWHGREGFGQEKHEHR